MQPENMFRFLALRSSVRRTAAQKRVTAYGRPENQTEFYRQTLDANEKRNAPELLTGLAAAHRGADAYLRQIESLEFDLKPLMNWALKNSEVLLGDFNLPNEIQSLYNATPNALATSTDFRNAWRRLSDTLLADSLSKTRRTPPARDEYVTAIKLLSLVEDVALHPDDITQDQTVHRWMRRTLVVLPRLRARRTGSRSPDIRIEPVPAPPRTLQESQKRIKALESAREDLMRVVADSDAFVKPRRGVQRETREERRLGPGRRPVAEAIEREEFSVERLRDLKEGPNRYYLSHRTYEGLSESTREVLQSIQVDPQQVNPFRVLPLIDRALTEEVNLAPDLPEMQTLIKLGGVTLNASKAKESFRYARPKLDFGKQKAGCGFGAGIGDLLIVRQNLKAYELSDFAHVENVLAGETREREHRRLNLREEVTTEEVETETQKDRDLQSTERNELQSEAEKTVTSEFGMEAGLQLSGSYGPTVSFSSSLTVGFSSSTEETQRESSSFAKEVTEKVSERTRARMREEHKVRVLEQIEEINRHGINNENAAMGHIRGIYRWLNKVYDAQVFNYGHRMMFEFIVPEPAAYFIYALIENPPGELEIKKPKPPVFKKRPLRPEHLTMNLAQRFIAQYEIVDAPVYPASSLVVSHFDSMDHTGKSLTFGRGSKIAIPPGYETNTALISSAQAGQNLDTFFVFLGGVWHVPLYDGITEVVTLHHPYQGEISITVYGGSIASYTLGIDMFCTLSAEGIRKWQGEMYDAIIRTYQALKADYDEKMAALEIQKGVEVLGRNPLENRRIERDELKKISIMMLTDDPDPSIDAMESGEEPVVDLDAACAASSRIRFFENAFEWRNMTYVFYPYFWGRKARWISALHLTDPDPDFAAFLKAGAARVQVPVRPGFERAIAYFCQTGKLWNGNDAPMIEDDLYVPIVEEITEKLGGPEEGVPYPEDSEPWEVRVPTSLVLLQNLEEIPGIRDVLTDQTTNLNPPQ